MTDLDNPAADYELYGLEPAADDQEEVKARLDERGKKVEGDGEKKPAKEAPPRDPLWLESLRTSLTITGIGSALVGFGYVAEAGHDELLGMNFPINRTVTDYALSGGRFFVDVITKCWLHPWVSLAGLFAIGISVAILAAIRSHWPERHWIVDACGLGFIVIILVWKGYRLDFPYIQLEGILTRMPLDESAGPKMSTHSSWRRFKEAELRDKFVCTHIARIRDELSPALNRRFPQCAVIALRMETISSDTAADLLIPSAAHESFSIEQEFIINAMAAAYLLVMIFATRRPPPKAGEPDLTTTWERMIRKLLIAVTIGSIATLPYVYGKVIHTTEAPAGRITFDSVDVVSNPPMKPTVDSADGLLIWADDKFVTMYRSDVFEFLHLSRTRVRYIAIDRVYDIIRVYAKSFCPDNPPHHATKRRPT